MWSRLFQRSDDMTMGWRTAAVLMALVGASAVAVGAQRGQSGAACGKACLQGIAGGEPAAPVPAGPATVQRALRRKVQSRQITEAEHVFARIDAPAQIAALQTPRPAFSATVPPAERMPRSWMFLLANAYYDSLVLGDGE